MSSRIRRASLPRTELGDDPNANRNVKDYMATIEPTSSADWSDSFVVSDEELEKMADPDWVYPNLIIQGHILVVVAPPNGGKTTLMLWVAGQIADDYEVFYVNADVSGSDAKAMAQTARAGGFKMMFPDMKVGRSMADVVHYLEEMNRKAGDYSNRVYIFDTLKKMTDVINKSRTNRLFETLRGLSAKGATIVLLAHTNKYAADDGKQIFEGTGDVRADADEMIYLEAQKHSDRSMTLSTVLEKVRGEFEPLTFDITRDRRVTHTKYRDIKKENDLRKQRKKDEEVIEMITEALSNESMNQQGVVNHCRDAGFSASRVRGVLRRYSKGPDTIWSATKGEKNSWNYRLVTLGENQKT